MLSNVKLTYAIIWLCVLFSQVLFASAIFSANFQEFHVQKKCPVLYEGFPTCLIFHVPSIIPGPRWSKVPVMTSSFRHPLSIQIQFNFYNPNVILTYVVTFKNNPIQYIGATNKTAGCIQLICIFTYYYLHCMLLNSNLIVLYPKFKLLSALVMQLTFVFFLR